MMCSGREGVISIGIAGVGGNRWECDQEWEVSVEEVTDKKSLQT
jgi:hypothetical protein